MGKCEFAFLCYMLLTFLWSDTKLNSLAMSGLWLGMFLIQLMVSNLCDTESRLRKLIIAFTASGAIAGTIGVLQTLTRVLKSSGVIDFLFPNPLYDKMDTFVLTRLPFQMVTTFHQERSNGPFNNPNVFGTFLVLAFPFALYCFVTAKGKRQKILSIIGLLLISLGMATTESRGLLLATVIGALFLIIFYGKKHLKSVVGVLIAGIAAITPSVAIRVMELFSEAASKGADTWLELLVRDQSTTNHLKIWFSSVYHIFTHPDVFIGGLGAGIQNVWDLLKNTYHIDRPHAHNIILEIWLEIGIIGVILFCASLFFFYRNMTRLYKMHETGRLLATTLMAAMTAFMIFGMTDYLFNSPKQMQCFFITLGLGQAAYSIYVKKKRVYKEKELIAKEATDPLPLGVEK